MEMSMISRSILFSAHVALLLMACAAEPQVFVTYEQHGAVGDGKTDDRVAIVAAHADANAKGLPVRARKCLLCRVFLGAVC